MDVLQYVSTPAVRSAVLSLTARELEILEFAGKGLSVKGIAQRLGISPGTVTWHTKNSYLKLGASSREDALKKARAERLIEAVVVCEICACAIASGNAQKIAEFRKHSVPYLSAHRSI